MDKIQATNKLIVKLIDFSNSLLHRDNMTDEEADSVLTDISYYARRIADDANSLLKE